MQTHFIKSKDGTKLHIKEAGNAKGKSVLFIHGFSQCELCWIKQLNSDLKNNYHLIFMDLRGHGLSDKPVNVYDNPKLWADDIQSIINALNLNEVVLVGSSYAGLIICDYLREYGENQVSGINWVDAISRFVKSDVTELINGLLSENTEECVNTFLKYIKMFSYNELSETDLYLMLGCNLMPPPYVRKGLLSRELDNENIILNLTKPVLITHGIEDKIVPISEAKHHKKLIKNAETSFYENTSHMPFWENPERFNAELQKFIETL